MIFHTLDALPGPYDHVYLSPHLDDAALSCGGSIAQQRAAGQSVLVVTLCTAAPPPAGPFSDLARSFHEAWGLSPAEAVAARLREDEAAMAALGADALWAGKLDAIYRHPAVYNRREALFGAPDPDDPLLPELRALIGALRERMPQATIYAPLGVGHHVDHLLTCRAALAVAGEPLAFYEDFPYVARDGELERRMAGLGLPLSARVIALDGAAAPKAAAISAYTSQMAELAESQLGRPAAGDEALRVMLAAVAARERAVGGERFWARA